MKHKKWAKEAENQRYVPPFVRRLMKGASEAEIQEATDNLRSYIQALWSISLSLERQAAVSIEKSVGRNRRKRHEAGHKT